MRAILLSISLVSADVVVGFISGGVAVLVSGLYVVLVLRSISQRTPAGVVKALNRSNSEHSVRVPRWPAGAGTWNPAKPPGVNNPIFEAGSGTYSLDPDGEVHLQWLPRNGHSHEYSGSIPGELTSSSPRRQRTRRIIRAAVAIYLAGLVIGFTAGYFVSAGPATTRTGLGVVGIFIAMIAMWFAIMLLNVIRGSHAALSHKNRSRS